MEYKNIAVSLEAGVYTITLSRPKQLNALNAATLQELEHAVMRIYNESEIHGVIITGAGDKAFVAGADIKEFLSHPFDKGAAIAENGQRIFKLIEDSPKPVIAAVNGYALGGGCELALACHLRMASENAKFGQPEVNLGIPPGYGGTQRLIQTIGKTKAFELLMTADMVGAEEALQLGLVNYVFSSDELMAKTEALLKKIMSKSPVAVAGVIKAVNAYFTSGVDGFQAEVDVFGDSFSKDDLKEGANAFMEKRRANFR